MITIKTTGLKVGDPRVRPEGAPVGDCPATHKNHKGFYFCTLDADHPGPVHVAEDATRVIAIWPVTE